MSHDPEVHAELVREAKAAASMSARKAERLAAKADAHPDPSKAADLRFRASEERVKADRLAAIVAEREAAHAAAVAAS